jgi:hypothetical protein
MRGIKIGTISRTTAYQGEFCGKKQTPADLVRDRCHGGMIERLYFPVPLGLSPGSIGATALEIVPNASKILLSN